MFIFIPRLYNKLQEDNKKHNRIEIEKDKVVFSRVHAGTTNTFPGGASFINRNIFNRLGFYDEKMFIGFEEYELSLRGILNNKPIKAKLIQDIQLIHIHRAPKNSELNMVKERYDQKILETSSNRIEEKHGVRLGSGWKVWMKEYEDKLLNLEE